MSTNGETTPSRAARRGTARLTAVQALYQADITAAPVEEVIQEFIAHRLGREIDGATYAAVDATFFADLVRGVTENGAAIDEAIAGALVKGWSLDRLDRTLRATLRAATYELMKRADVPARVVINEYMDVAHAFFGAAEPGLVNGILDHLGQHFRPGELRSNDDQRSARAR